MARVSRVRFARALVDLPLLAAAYVLSYFLRFDGLPPAEFKSALWNGLPIIVAAELLIFWVFGLYRSIWGYTSLAELVQLVRAVGVSALVVGIYGLGFHYARGGFPRSVIIINATLVLLLCGGIRCLWRICRRVRYTRVDGGNTRVLIVGAGDAGSGVAREMLDNRDWGYAPVCFVDDDESKRGQRLRGLPVLGPLERIPELVRDLKIGQIVVAVPSVRADRLRRIATLCESAKVPFRILPGVGELLDGRISVSRLRRVEIEDLLGREPVVLDVGGAAGYLRGRRVLITGAGGSIGSEICRQVARLEPELLVLLSRGEHSLYQIDTELAAAFPGLQRVQVNGDVVNLFKLRQVFARWSPEVVFHAAANKHVHLCECNMDEAVLTNVIGTHNVLVAGAESGVERVVVISTDKASDPAGILGCTKRLSELLVMERSWGEMVATAVRFGNVLGSRGSVIPLFRKQIAMGGPLTVTHPDMVRFFMTIPEAATLVIHAGGIARGRELFVLDMGQAVNILSMAKEMIRLSGYEPETEVPITFTGIRPGEKLEETLIGGGETLMDSDHRSIQVIRPQAARQALTDGDLQELHRLAVNMDSEGIRAKLADLLPSYRETIAALASSSQSPLLRTR